MSHEKRYGTYEEGVNKMAVEAEWNSVARQDDWREGCAGLPRSIRWLSVICEDYSSAMEYISSHDRGDYDQLAVKYKERIGKETSKTVLALEERADRLSNRFEELDGAVHYQGCKSAFVSCRHCGSKIASKFFGTTVKNRCPVCREDLRPESTLADIEAAKKNRDKAQEELRRAQEKAGAKAQYRLMWLVKVEYHT